MKLGELSPRRLFERLANDGLRFRVGPFSIHLQTRLPRVAESLRHLYAEFSTEEDDGVAEFHTRLARPVGLRRWYRPQVFFYIDGQNLFEPFPLALAPPLFEWGLNWCVSSRAHRFLILHSAVVERSGRAIILPAHPGSGKSTVCTGLVHRGYRLLSDEHVLLQPEDGRIMPVPRPIAVKNESIDVLKRFAPELVWGPAYHDARKGLVTHVKPPAESVARASETALPGAIVFPRYQKDAPTKLELVPRAKGMMELVDNSINYSLWGARGFDTLARLVESTPCYALTYGELEAAMEALDGVEAAP